MIHLLLLSALLATALSHPVSVFPGDNPRATWNGYDLSTNYYEQVPDTGVVREYFFDILNTTAAPDGRDRGVLLVNGQFPGPTIVADWGDIVKVTVRNSMQNNGSSIHWHGVRQFYTPQMDGTPSITQCPIAPGQNYTYTWRADQYGSSWYHSHFSLQAWDGIFGGITINGPASADYDEDLGSLFLSDWSVESVDALYPDQLRAAYNAQFTSGLLNGTNVYDFGNGTIVGERLKTTLTPGKRYRLRLISATMHTMYKFSVDNHNLTVIANDFVPVQPFSTKYVSINSGQRYDVILEANQPADNYWMRAFPLDQCSNNTSPDNIKGIIHYDTASSDDPTTSKNEYGSESLCFDMNMDGFDLTPVLALDANITGATTVTTPVSTYAKGAPTEYFWEIGQLPFSTRWNDPTLLVATTVPNANYSEAQNVIRTDTPYEWTILVMQTTVKLSHPIHLHGHDFWILASGVGIYSPSNVTLNTINPPRRDTVTLPSDDTDNGYTVIAWPADNPGTWLLHCHVGFHATEGMALQLLERNAEIPALVDQAILQDTCNAWNAFGEMNPYGVQDTALVGLFESGV